jgi:glycosyltransferase involved in cell wall biosynthesis
MKIAFVTTYDATDINSWSGTPYYMSKSFIDYGVEVEFIGNLKSPSRLIPRIKEIVFNRLFKGKFGEFISFYEPSNLKCFAAQVEKKLQVSNADIVFSPGALPIAYLKTNKPIVMWSDATFAVMHNYSGFTNLCSSTIRSCHMYERNVIKRLSLAIFSSEWAAKSAIEYYRANENIVKVIPYGANIAFDRTIKEIIEINKLKSRSICKLLFVGKYWERKGGNAAVNIACELNNLNIKTELTILGCMPPNSSLLPNFIKIIGFVDKSKKEGNDLFERLYKENHFFVLPSIADCTPIVFSEANSYGLPVITTNTGGIPSIIKDDVNGKMFDVKLDAVECAKYIGQIFTDFDKYEEFSIKAFEEYITVLNWKVSIAKIFLYLQQLLNS